ncbi:protein ARV 2 isoform X2 [Populus alba]|uniref:protein ARV 2 isoform X2 n=1 Tax=Populus alba TaxID=43335 RepID=UPI003CC76605
MEHRCVECGFPIETLFLQYSPGNIRLLRCANCEAVADEYIECEFMIILIDLILHKTKAYRHLLFSVINQRRVNFEGCFAGFVMEVNLCVSSFGCLLKSSFKKKRGRVGFFHELFFNCFDIPRDTCGWLCWKLYVYLCFSSFNEAVAKHIDSNLQVWEFPFSVIFIIDLFVLSSNTVALKVISESAMNRCIAACFCAHAVKLLVTQISTQRSLRF